MAPHEKSNKPSRKVYDCKVGLEYKNNYVASSFRTSFNQLWLAQGTMREPKGSVNPYKTWSYLKPRAKSLAFLHPLRVLRFYYNTGGYPIYPACTIRVLLILFGPFEVGALVNFWFQYSTVLRYWRSPYKAKQIVLRQKSILYFWIIFLGLGDYF